MSEYHAVRDVIELEDTSLASVDKFIDRLSREAAADEETPSRRAAVANALKTFGSQRDLAWARLKLFEGGRNEKISGAPLYVGRWLGLNPEAVAILRADGTEDDYCRTLLVYDWLSLDGAEDLVHRSARFSKRDNVGRALSVAAETMMYRHGAFDRACEILEIQLRLYTESDTVNETASIVEQAKSLVRITMARLAAGQLAEAITTRDRAKAMVERLGEGFVIHEHAGTKSGGDLYPEISMESNFAWFIGGDWQAVADHWVFACGLEEPGGSPVHIIEAGMAAQAFARLNQFDNAHKMLRDLTPILKKLRPSDWGVNGAVGRGSHAIWDMVAQEYAEDYRALALDMIESGVGDWTNTSLELTVARMAALLGKTKEAYKYFAKARAKLSRKLVDPRLAIIDFDEAKAMRLLKSGDDEARMALLARADKTFHSLGLVDWLARSEAESAHG